MENHDLINFLNNNDNTQNISLLSLLMSEDDPFETKPPPPPTTTPPSTTTTTSSSDFHFFSPDDHNLPPLPESFSHPPLPQLLSLEPPSPPLPPPALLQKDSYSLESILEEFYSLKKRKKHHLPPPPLPPPKRTICDKAYALWKILPGNPNHQKRRSTAEMLGDAHKYIKFLQAQVGALRSMPMESRLGFDDGSRVGRLGRLSRQQVLQVVLNSPQAQMVMAEKGWCVFAAEQVALLKKIEARKILVHQLLASIPL